MEKASPVEMRLALEVVENFKRAGVLFVAMPVKGIEDRIDLQKQALLRLDSLALMAEKETRHKPYYEYPDGTPAKMKPCKKFHDLNQDKDGSCPYCGGPINKDF